MFKFLKKSKVRESLQQQVSNLKKEVHYLNKELDKAKKKLEILAELPEFKIKILYSSEDYSLANIENDYEHMCSINHEDKYNLNYKYFILLNEKDKPVYILRLN